MDLTDCIINDCSLGGICGGCFYHVKNQGDKAAGSKCKGAKDSDASANVAVINTDEAEAKACIS